jgi:hypothetical protein
MLASSLRQHPDTADSSDKKYFRSFCTVHSSHRLREGEKPEMVRDNMGHANIYVVVTDQLTCLAE